MYPPTIHLRLLPSSVSSSLPSSSLPSSSLPSSSPPSSSSPTSSLILPSLLSSSPSPSLPSSYLFQTLHVSSLSYLLPRSLLHSNNLLKIYKLTQPTQTTVSLIFESSTSFKPLLQAKLSPAAQNPSFFTEIQLKNTLSACLEALQSLHGAGLVHGLMRPDSLRLTEGNQIKLADWFCIMRGRMRDMGELVRQKCHYLPPEAFRRCLGKRFGKNGKLRKDEKLGRGSRMEEGGGTREERGGRMEEGGGKKEDGGGRREEMVGVGKFGEEGDLYSLGVLFLEMSTLVSGSELVDWVRRRVRRDKVEQGLERVMKRYSKGYWRVMKTLLEEDPKKRTEVWRVWKEEEEEEEGIRERGGEKEEENLEKREEKEEKKKEAKEDEEDEKEEGKEEGEEGLGDEEEKEEEREEEQIKEVEKRRNEEEERKELGKRAENNEDLETRKRTSMEVQTDHEEQKKTSKTLMPENNKENSIPTQTFQSPTSNLNKTLLFEKLQKKFDESISKTQILIERTKSLTTHNNFSKQTNNHEIYEIPSVQTPQFSSKQIIFPLAPYSTPYSLSPPSSSSPSLPPALPSSFPPPSSLTPPPPPSSNSLLLPPHSSSESHPPVHTLPPLSLLFPLLPSSSSPPILRFSSKNGLTTIFYKNGQKYQGDVEGLKRHGFGLLYTSSGRIYYQGEWNNDQYEGHGILNNPLWTIKDIGGGEAVARVGKGGIGAEREGKADEGGDDGAGRGEAVGRVGRGGCGRAIERAGGGEGALESVGNEGWLKYEGEFRKGKADGKGILLFSNKEYLDGKFCDGKVNGLCWLSMKSGERLFGEWKDNLFLRNLC